MTVQRFLSEDCTRSIREIIRQITFGVFTLSVDPLVVVLDVVHLLGDIAHDMVLTFHTAPKILVSLLQSSIRVPQII